MKDNEKKVKAIEEEAKKEAQTEEKGVELNDEELSSVAAGRGNDPNDPAPVVDPDHPNGVDK